MLSIKNFKVFYLLGILLFSFATHANETPEKPLTGKYTEKYHNGNLKYEVNYINGKKEGLETFWYISGGKYIQTSYKNDKEDGMESVVRKWPAKARSTLQKWKGRWFIYTFL